MALAALALSLGGGAYAASSAGGSVEWAVVSADGKLARGNGGVGAELLRPHGKPIPGNYEVLFNDDIRHCSYKATLGSAGPVPPPIGDVGVARMHHLANAVYVHTTNANGASADEGFHIAAIC